MPADSPLASVFGDASDTSETDQVVLDGALSAFLDFGIKRASMSEIAKRAGVSPATLYRRFASKAAVLEAVGMREAREFVRAVDARVDRSAPARAQVVEDPPLRHPRVAAGRVGFGDPGWPASHRMRGVRWCQAASIRVRRVRGAVGRQPVLRRLLVTEPDSILPQLTVGAAPVLASAASISPTR